MNIKKNKKILKKQFFNLGQKNIAPILLGIITSNPERDIDIINNVQVFKNILNSLFISRGIKKKLSEIITYLSYTLSNSRTDLEKIIRTYNLLSKSEPERSKEIEDILKKNQEQKTMITNLLKDYAIKKDQIKKQNNKLQELELDKTTLRNQLQEKENIIIDQQQQINFCSKELQKCQDEKDSLLSMVNQNNLGFHSLDSSSCVSFPLTINKIDSLNTFILNENNLEQKRIKNFDKKKYSTLSPFIQKNVKKLTHWFENKKYNLYDRKKNKNHLKRFIDILLTSSECEKLLKVSKPIARKILRIFQDLFKDCFNIFIKSNGSKGRGHSLTIQLSFKNNSY